jgi:Protein of unknown function (DUF3617)
MHCLEGKMKIRFKLRSGSRVFGVGASVMALGLLALAQGDRKPGLWEITTNMTWQQSPFPAGMQVPPQAAAAFGGGPQTTQVCLTQAMIDKYGAPMPQSHDGCQITNVQKSATGMTADLVCTGNTMNGKASVESHWSDSGTASGKVHFVGTIQRGPSPIPIEWTAVSNSVYKGSDCGSVKPPPMPAGN